MHEEIEAAELAIERRAQRREVLVVGDVARQDERILELRRQLADVLLEPFARIRQRDPRALGRRRLRDRPRDGPLVGHTNDQSELSSQIRHS